MYIHAARKEIHLKIVYYGPALSGKTTNLQIVHSHTNPAMRGELLTLNTRKDRTIYFDFLQLELGKIGGLTPKFSLYTVPGQSYYATTRKVVLRGADGLVFVVDSHVSRIRENLAALRDMQSFLEELGISPASLPMVVQLNKRDLPEAAPVAALRQYLELNGKAPCFPAVAVQGIGVFDTLKAILRASMRNVQQSMAGPAATTG